MNIHDRSRVHNTDFVSNLKISQNVNQIIIVSAKGDVADISMHNKNEKGIWKELFNTSGYIGKNGIGKIKEGDMKTPTGIYHFTDAFGIKQNPGTALKYVQVDDSYYWVDDYNSVYYNKFVSSKNVVKDWKSAENILSVGNAYNYVLALDYNIERVPGRGSAIFLHCSTGNPTAGCISVQEEYMIKMLKEIKKDCIILIDKENNINNY